MSYERQEFKDHIVNGEGVVTQKGTTLKASHLNHIEDGIIANEKAINNLANGAVGSLNIVYVGNSFSQNATRYIYNVLTNLGYSDFTVGIAYLGGCSLATHLSNLKANKVSYDYEICNNSNAGYRSEGKKSLYEILTVKNWDFVILQQNSSNTDDASTYEDVYEVLNYCKKYCPNASYGWHMTWENKGANYADIVSAVKATILKNAFFDFIIPNGTVIQNASTSYVDNSYIWETDDLHLATAHPFGKFVATLGTVKGILREKVNIDDVTFKSTLTDDEFVVAKESVANAYQLPFSVTQSAYPAES